MNGQLFSCFVRGKRIPGKKFDKILDGEPLIIAPLTYTLIPVTSRPPLSSCKSSQSRHATPLLKANSYVSSPLRFEYQVHVPAQITTQRPHFTEQSNTIKI